MTTPFERPAADGPLRAAWRDLASATPAPGAHLTEDDWVRLAAGELDADARDRAADHIEACAACADVFRAVAALRTGAAAIDPGAPALVPPTDDAADQPGSIADAPPAGTSGSPFTPRGWWYGLAAAAVLALAVGATLWRGSPGTAPATRVAGSAPTASAAPGPVAAPGPARPGTDTAGATAGRAAPALRAWAELASAPAVMLPASFTIVMRGEANPARDAFLTAFGPAIAPYRAGRYADAAGALESLTARFPDVDEGWFYLGVSRLYADRPAEAVEPLRRARRSEVVADEALWLEVVALERAGRSDEATAALRVVCEADRQTHAGACATLPAQPR